MTQVTNTMLNSPLTHRLTQTSLNRSLTRPHTNLNVSSTQPTNRVPMLHNLTSMTIRLHRPTLVRRISSRLRFIRTFRMHSLKLMTNLRRNLRTLRSRFHRTTTRRHLLTRRVNLNLLNRTNLSRPTTHTTSTIHMTLNPHPHLSNHITISHRRTQRTISNLMLTTRRHAQPLQHSRSRIRIITQHSLTRISIRTIHRRRHATKLRIQHSHLPPSLQLHRIQHRRHSRVHHNHHNNQLRHTRTINHHLHVTLTKAHTSSSFRTQITRIRHVHTTLTTMTSSHSTLNLRNINIASTRNHNTPNKNK